MTTMAPDRFQKEFSSRTLAYVPGFSDPGTPLVVSLGPDAQSPAGHALLVSLTNQLARVHRSLIFVGDLDVPLLCPDVFGSGGLAQATAGLARAINPFIEADICSALPECDRLMVIGVGDVRGADLRVGYDGWRALIGDDARTIEAPSAMWGALLAACLAAGLAFHRALGTAQRIDGTFSLWEYGRPGGSEGPSDTGLSVGRVLQAGAGAVGCALDLYLALLAADVSPGWIIVDGDIVDVSNLNRHLLFLARDAGYPEGSPAFKAETAARRLSPDAQASPHWYGDDPSVLTEAYDLVLALANERGVREALQARQPTVLLHATTSNNWQAQVHRHIAGRDDCISCRIPPNAPRLRCSTSAVQAEGIEVDATLPFLSAAAGLMLAAALARLADGALLDEPYNFAALDFGSPHLRFQRLTNACRDGCRVRLAPAVRASMDSASRYVGLDGGAG